MMELLKAPALHVSFPLPARLDGWIGKFEAEADFAPLFGEEMWLNAVKLPVH